jgi:hypothetical protein
MRRLAREKRARQVALDLFHDGPIQRPFPMMLRTLWKGPERYVQKCVSHVPGC